MSAPVSVNVNVDMLEETQKRQRNIWAVAWEIYSCSDLSLLLKGGSSWELKLMVISFRATLEGAMNVSPGLQHASQRLVWLGFKDLWHAFS